MLEDRAKILLKALVERYIADGQPVGSRTLSRASGLELSAATIRNVMADLEELGLIVSPHTSSGRVPTARGYRLFVDTMLTARPMCLDDIASQTREQLQPDQPQRVISNAAQMLSSLSQFVGVVTAPRKATVFRHIEFLRLGERRILVEDLITTYLTTTLEPGDWVTIGDVTGQVQEMRWRSISCGGFDIWPPADAVVESEVLHAQIEVHVAGELVRDFGANVRSYHV